MVNNTILLSTFFLSTFLLFLSWLVNLHSPTVPPSRNNGLTRPCNNQWDRLTSYYCFSLLVLRSEVVPIWSLLCAISSVFPWPSGYPSRRSERSFRIFTNEDGGEILRVFHGNQKIWSLPTHVFPWGSCLCMCFFWGGAPLWSVEQKKTWFPRFSRRKIFLSQKRSKVWSLLGWSKNGPVRACNFNFWIAHVLSNFVGCPSNSPTLQVVWFCLFSTCCFFFWKRGF